MKFRFLDLFVSECRRAREKFPSLERDPEEIRSIYEKVFRWEEIFSETTWYLFLRETLRIY